MKLHELEAIKSERGLRSVLNALWFGSKGALLAASANFENVSNTVRQLTNAGYADRAETIRNSVRYQKLEQSANEAAERAAAIHAFAEAKSHQIEVDFTPEYQRGKDEKQIAAAAEASGVSADLIREKERKAIEQRYAAQLYAKLAAETLFWSASGCEVDSVAVKSETVLNSLVRQRDFMLEWSNLDLGELTLLKHDINFVEHLINVEENQGESSEGSIDEGMTVESSMTDMNRQYQAEIASTRKALGADEDEEAPAKPIGKGGKAGTARAVKATTQ